MLLRGWWEISRKLPLERGKVLWSGFACWCHCWSPDKQRCHEEINRWQMVLAKTAFRVDFLCFRSDCYSALTVNSMCFWECKKQVGASFLIFIKQVTRYKGSLASWELTHRYLLIVIVCCLCERKWGKGEQLWLLWNQEAAIQEPTWWTACAGKCQHVSLLNLAHRLSSCLTKFTKQTGAVGGVFFGQTVMGEGMANGGCYAVVLLLIMGVMPGST